MMETLVSHSYGAFAVMDGGHLMRPSMMMESDECSIYKSSFFFFFFSFLAIESIFLRYMADADFRSTPPLAPVFSAR